MKLKNKILPAVLFSISCVLAVMAFRFCFVTEKFNIPIAFVAKGEKLFVMEKADNTVLELAWTDEGRKLRLEKKHSIEPDDQDYYYMVRQMYPAKDGIVVSSCIYSHKTQAFAGFRFREFRYFSEKPEDIFTFHFDKAENEPEITYCSDDKGDHYFTNNCEGRKNIWKIAHGNPVVMEYPKLPAGIAEMGEMNTETSSWMEITTDSSGKIFLPSAETGKIIEYSPAGERIRELGTVGFGKDELLAPASIFFIKMPGNESSLLTVGNKGNRSWLQFDAGGNPANTILPLEMGYGFPDILVNSIYPGTGGRYYSFDLANKSAIVIGDKINAVSEYGEKKPVLFIILIASSLIFLCATWKNKLVSASLSKRRVPFFLKLVILFIPMLAASSYITGLWVKGIVKKNLDTESLRRSANIAHDIISSISVSDLEQIRKPEDRLSPAYDKIYMTAKRISEDSGVEQTPKWILHKIYNNRYYFGINSWKGPIFEPFIIPKEREMFFKVLREKTPQSGTYKDDQGEWFSYLWPVTDGKGKIINVLELYRDTEALSRTDKEIAFKVRCVIAGTAFVAIAILLVFSYVFTRPLRSLMKGIRILGEGNFDNRIKVLSRDELGDLAISFNQMIVELKKYMNDLAATTSQKEKMESELRIAHDIQMSIIPNTFPAFPERIEFDLHAMLVPARAVGGDLYDFFFIDENRLCFAVGDVSGKGVPASLFMAITRTLLRAKAFGCSDTGKIISEMNLDLLAGNSMSMFVTFFLGVLDIRTGEIKYTNAGHNPPFIIRKDGSIEKIDKLHGMPLGIFECEPYEVDCVSIAKGDSVVLYTDGVTEAANRDDILYEEERLVSSLAKVLNAKAEDGIKALYNDVNSFVEGAEQSDDITILVLNYHGTADCQSPTES